MNKVVHFELPFEDKDRAMKFFSETFGWQMQDVPQMNYVLATTTQSGDQGPLKPGAINGGMGKKGDQITVPSFSIEVPSIDEAFVKIKAEGGEVVSEKTPVGEMGFMAYFKDTEGNVLSLWENVGENK